MDFFSDQQVTEDVPNKFSNNLQNATLHSHTSNTTLNKICVTKKQIPEPSLIKENKFPPLPCTGQNPNLNKTLLTLSNTSLATDSKI